MDYAQRKSGKANRLVEICLPLDLSGVVNPQDLPQASPGRSCNPIAAEADLYVRISEGKRCRVRREFRVGEAAEACLCFAFKNAISEHQFLIIRLQHLAPILAFQVRGSFSVSGFA